jgi:hypothetical protein
MTKPNCEDYIPVDIRQLHRAGKLLPGLSTVQHWTYGALALGTVFTRAEADAVLLQYRPPEAKTCTIVNWGLLTFTSCRYGGQRPWFICTAFSGGRCCLRRVAVLYFDLGANRFACRHCCGLTYASQKEGVQDRSIRRARKIRMTLGGSASLGDQFPSKPKGMRWHSYERLRCAYEAAEKAASDGLMSIVDKIRQPRA